jgi:hypothetical protein
MAVIISCFGYGHLLRLASAEQPRDQGSVTSNSLVMSRINEVNNLKAQPRFLPFPTTKSDSATAELSKRYWSIRHQLALDGVCLESKNGVLVHGTRDALNGFTLQSEDLKSLAMINFLEQGEQDASRSLHNYQRWGETQALTDALVRQLSAHGVFVELRGYLYVVQSIQTNSAVTDVARQPPNVAPTNASTTFPEK